MRKLESIPGRIANGFYEKAAIWEENFAIRGHRKHYIELKICGLDKGRGMLLWRSMTKFQSISWRIANGFYENAPIWEENFAISGHQKY